MSETRDISRRKNLILSWFAVGIWSVGLFLLSGLRLETVQAMQQLAVSAVEKFLGVLFSNEFSSGFYTALYSVVCVGIQMMGFGILAVFIWNAVRISGASNRRAMILGAAGSMFYAATDELHQLFVPDRLPMVKDWAIDSVGVVLVLGGLFLFRWAIKKYPKVLNRETISYVVYGVMTTLVNMVAYGLCYNTLQIHNLISNAVAWVAAVLFAYIVNKLFVFQSHTNSRSEAIREFALFIGARVFSFGVDELGMWLLVNILSVNGGVSKIATNVIVMVMNYFFSKWFIFKSAKEEQL